MVGVHYDSMLAKLVAWAPTRYEAARMLAGALARTQLHGLVTNRDLLVRVLRHPAFLTGQIDTGLLDRQPEVFAPLLSSVEAVRLELPGRGAGRRRRAPGGGARCCAGIPSRLAQRALRRADRRSTTARPARSRSATGSTARARWPSGGSAPSTRRSWTWPGSGQVGLVDDHPPVAVVSAAPDEVVLDVAGIRLALRRAPGRRDVSYVDSAGGLGRPAPSCPASRRRRRSWRRAR